MPLNIDWQQILLHLFNFVVLFAILYFLLYKPVKQFMDKRTAYYKEMDDKANKALEKSEQIKEEYENKISAAEDEISLKKEKARNELEKANAAGIKKAEETAEKLLNDARLNIEAERAKMLKDAKKEISDIVASATEKLVLKEGTFDSYEQFLTEVERGENNE